MLEPVQRVVAEIHEQEACEARQHHVGAAQWPGPASGLQGELDAIEGARHGEEHPEVDEHQHGVAADAAQALTGCPLIDGAQALGDQEHDRREGSGGHVGVGEVHSCGLA